MNITQPQALKFLAAGPTVKVFRLIGSKMVESNYQRDDIITLIKLYSTTLGLSNVFMREHNKGIFIKDGAGFLFIQTNDKINEMYPRGNPGNKQDY